MPHGTFETTGIATETKAKEVAAGYKASGATEVKIEKEPGGTWKITAKFP